MPPPIMPEPPAKAKDSSLEAKRAQVRAAVMKPTEAPLPEPPPPEPPTWDPDLPAPTPYAASRNQPPLPAPQFAVGAVTNRSEEHTSELQSHLNLVCRLLLEKKKQ